MKKLKEKIKECCENCKYWYKKGDTQGLCRRNPPGEDGWSFIFNDDYCGEFKPKK